MYLKYKNSIIYISELINNELSACYDVKIGFIVIGDINDFNPYFKFKDNKGYIPYSILNKCTIIRQQKINKILETIK